MAERSLNSGRLFVSSSLAPVVATCCAGSLSSRLEWLTPLARYPVCCRLNLNSNSANEQPPRKQVMLPQAPPDNKDIISGIDPSRSVGRPVEKDESIWSESASRRIRRCGAPDRPLRWSAALRFRCARREAARRAGRRIGSRLSAAARTGSARLLMIRCRPRTDVCFGRIAG